LLDSHGGKNCIGDTRPTDTGSARDLLKGRPELVAWLDDQNGRTLE
jgi:hypothetical protein